MINTALPNFGNLLFDNVNDPGQLQPLHNEEVENQMIQKMIKLMKENDCPSEQYHRLDLEKHLR